MRFPIKAVLVTALLIVVPTVVAAQAEVGFRGGLSIATLGGDDAGDVGSKTALNIGGFVTVPFSDAVGIQFGAGFAQKGAAETEMGVEVEIGVDYVEIPVLLILSPPTTGNIGVDFFVGPAVGFRAGCTITGREGGVEVSLDCDDPDVDAPLKSFDFGAMVGAGLNIAVGANVDFVIDGFYNLGLSKIDDSGIEDDAKNRAFSVLAGLSFAVGG